jgi:TolB protein
MGRVASDGTLVYVSSASGNEELYSAGANLTNSAKSDTWPSFSPDGSKVIFTSRREGDYDTYIMNRDGSGCNALISSENDEGRAVISPDGGYIAVSVEEGADYEIYIYDIDGEFVKKLTDNDAADYEPHWGK